jgi:histidyl-tRNA synthetase
MKGKNKLDTESYKGVRDFYPENMFVQNYIFGVWREVVESFGYLEYGASVLEPAELYVAKSGEEIVNEQTYTFKDRGDRDVTLRPEMTPTVARMVAGKSNELSFPLRWYSIPNLFRYEKPQRGRLREHWQLNVDIFGVENGEADAEIISIAYQIMNKFGAKDEDFVIKINNRKLLEELFTHLKLDPEQTKKVSKIIDKKDKISPAIFEASLFELIGDKKTELIDLLSSNEKLLDTLNKNAGENGSQNAKETVELIEKLSSIGVTNTVLSPTLMRGFDYYNGIVFEVFDTHSDNNRSLFGGGRYNNLTELFSDKDIPAFGFGMGDVTAKDFLEVRNLLPRYRPQTQLYICNLGPEFLNHVRSMADSLRKAGLNVAIDLSNKKLGDQIKTADRQYIPYVICVGENEVKSNTYSVKDMQSGEEKRVKLEEIAGVIKR